MLRSISFQAVAVLILILLYFLWPSSLPAQNASVDQAPVLQDTPRPPKAPQTEVQQRKVPVSLEYTDQDSLGRRLVLNLRERFDKSRLFRLSSGNERSLQLVVRSREEFTGRPGISSVYFVIWTFSYGQNVLSNYLSSETGFVRPEDIAELTETLVARTDEIATQYGYLFED